MGRPASSFRTVAVAVRFRLATVGAKVWAGRDGGGEDGVLAEIGPDHGDLNSA
jgi:hypothetical protein